MSIKGYLQALGLLTLLNLGICGRADALSFNFGTNSFTGSTSLNTTVTGLSGLQDISLSLNLTNNDLSNLEIYLQSPVGKILNIAAFLNGNTINATLTDSAGVSNQINTGIDPYTGSFSPSGFSAFPNGLFSSTTTANITTFADFNDGSSLDGTWTLFIDDVNNANLNGKVNSATLNISPIPFDFSPEPAIAVIGTFILYKKLKKKAK